MWVADDRDRSSYYIFQDGQVYYTGDSVLEEKGIESLVRLDFQTAIHAISEEELLGSPEHARMDPQKEILILNKGDAGEKHIVIEESFVSIKNAGEESGIALMKKAETPDFTGEYFEALFNEVRENMIEAARNESAPPESEPAETEPAQTEPMQTAPMLGLPYKVKLKASVAIYAEPGDSGTFVQTVNQDGVYTIAEEAYDEAGNLWGRLKSGVGWVILRGDSPYTEKRCPQCHLTEPDTVFTED